MEMVFSTEPTNSKLTETFYNTPLLQQKIRQEILFEKNPIRTDSLLGKNLSTECLMSCFQYYFRLLLMHSNLPKKITMTTKRILVAEDNKLILETVVFKLQKEGYEVVKAMNGKESLEYLQNDTFDLLITDLFMPFISGLEVISSLRSEMKSDLPILVLSAAGAEETVLKAFELGADDYMTKPFSLGELSIRVKKLIGSRK